MGRVANGHLEVDNDAILLVRVVGFVFPGNSCTGSFLNAIHPESNFFKAQM